MITSAVFCRKKTQLICPFVVELYENSNLLKKEDYYGKLSRDLRVGQLGPKNIPVFEDSFPPRKKIKSPCKYLTANFFLSRCSYN